MVSGFTFYVFTRKFKEHIEYIASTLYNLRLGSIKIMADIDILNAAVAAVQGDETAETALGAQLFASIQLLQQEAAAGTPNLQPAIAALEALHSQAQAQIAAGTTFAATLPTGTATATTTAPATGATGTSATPPAQSP
jgi:hypothetical protein